ncbi:HNH endonuclease [Lactobacillus sp. CC-MHH1034]|uniref:HNH endonuclease n=1 Tax=Agrilactobacillus fermenti TaxID=2586909 RepID=UPI001E4A8206|nr:HNH endonuclease [Agrilactobacillus fermenti]MCD2255731.1 HNH endonuclease [Agrilactobacillus fermenti]
MTTGVHLRCVYCGLTLPASLFHVDQTYFSLCYFCRQRGLTNETFYNPYVFYYAQAREQTYVGATTAVAAPTKLALSKQKRRALTKLITDYLTGPKRLQELVPLAQFAKSVLALEDQSGSLPLTGVLLDDLEHLKFHVKQYFHQNKLDYTTRQMVREKYHYTCQYCGRYADSVDHKNPAFLSQDNHIDNLTLACKECNRLKGDMPYDLFVTLNQRIMPLNHRLVQSEKTLRALQNEIDHNRRQLAARQHLTADIQDAQLQAFRHRAKVLQFVADSVTSDYQQQIKLRHDFILTQAQIQANFGGGQDAGLS